MARQARGRLDRNASRYPTCSESATAVTAYGPRQDISAPSHDGDLFVYDGGPGVNPRPSVVNEQVPIMAWRADVLSRTISSDCGGAFRACRITARVPIQSPASLASHGA